LPNFPARGPAHGFNLIARPEHQGGNDIFLELNLTEESLVFDSIGAPIPNRGTSQDDIQLFGIHVGQRAGDHGSSGNGQRGPHGFDSTRKLLIGRRPVLHGCRSSGLFAGQHRALPRRREYSAAGSRECFSRVQSRYRQPVPDQHAARRHHVGNDHGPNTISDGGGGVENIPFLTTNANAATVLATFWIEKVKHPSGFGHFLQLQYVQTVLLNFLGLSWPHVSVATLVKH
jgi:hypothetical protein